MTEQKKIYIISYYNLKEKLAGGLRANELFKYLKKERIDVELITRYESEGYETIIKDYSIPIKLRKGLHLIFPDSSITWVLKLYHFFKNKKNILLIVTTPPHGLLYLSYLLRNNNKIKFIHDFRDPFTLNAHPQRNIFLRKTFNKWIEKFMIENTDYIIFNTDEHKEIFLKNYEENFRHEVIKNGYITENFTKKNRERDLVYFGGHYSGKITEVLFEFISVLNSKTSKKHVIDIYGDFHPNYDKYKTVFNFQGKKNRSELFDILSQYKIGIVCYSEYYEGRGIATKFYEIIGLGIVPYCINPSRDLINLMEELEFGSYCYQDNLEEMDVSFFTNFKPIIQDERTLRKIRKYSRENQNSFFLKIIDDL
jgi:hypothetical protein